MFKTREGRAGRREPAGRWSSQVFTAFGDFDVKYAGIPDLTGLLGRPALHVRSIHPDLRRAPVRGPVGGGHERLRAGHGDHRADAGWPVPGAAGAGRAGDLLPSTPTSSRDGRHRPRRRARHLGRAVRSSTDALKGVTKFGHAYEHPLARPLPAVVPDLLQLHTFAAPHRGPDPAADRQPGPQGFAADAAWTVSTSASTIMDATRISRRPMTIPKLWYNGDVASTTTFTELIIDRPDPAQSPDRRLRSASRRCRA